MDKLRNNQSGNIGDSAWYYGNGWHEAQVARAQERMKKKEEEEALRKNEAVIKELEETKRQLAEAKSQLEETKKIAEESRKMAEEARKTAEMAMKALRDANEGVAQKDKEADKDAEPKIDSDDQGVEQKPGEDDGGVRQENFGNQDIPEEVLMDVLVKLKELQDNPSLRAEQPNAAKLLDLINSNKADTADEGVEQISDTADEGVEQISDTADEGVEQSSDNGDEGVEQSFGSTGAQGEGQRAGMGNNPTGAGEWLVMPENRERALRNLEKKQGWLRKFKYNFKKIGLFVVTILAVGAVTGTTLSDNSQARNVKTESVDGSLMNELKTEANGQEGELDLDSEYGEQGESSMVNFEHNGFTMEAKINKHKGGYDERTDPYFAKKRSDRKTAFTPFAYNPEDPEPVRLTNMVEGNINNISKSYMNLSLWSTMMNSLDDTGNLPSMKDVNDFSIKLKEMGESGQTGEYDEQANKIATYFENFFKEGGRVETGTIEANKPYASLYISQNEGDGQLEMGFDDYVTHDHASEYVKFFDKDGKDILNEGPLKDVIVSIMNSASKSGAVFSGQYEIVWSAGCGQFCVFYESDLTVNIKPNPDDDDGGGGNNGGGGGGGKKREDDGGGDKHEDDDGGGDKHEDDGGGDHEDDGDNGGDNGNNGGGDNGGGDNQQRVVPKTRNTQAGPGQVIMSETDRAGENVGRQIVDVMADNMVNPVVSAGAEVIDQVGQNTADTTAVVESQGLVNAETGQMMTDSAGNTYVSGTGGVATAEEMQNIAEGTQTTISGDTSGHQTEVAVNTGGQDLSQEQANAAANQNSQAAAGSAGTDLTGQALNDSNLAAQFNSGQ